MPDDKHVVSLGRDS